MKIDLLDDNTYAVIDDNGIEIEKGAIRPEWREQAATRRWGIRRVIADAKKVKVEKPLAVQVEGETVITVPAHEHEYDERYAAAEHDHPLKEHDHQHTHPEFATHKTAIEQESRYRLEADQVIDKKLTEHAHPEYAQAFHSHEDVYANLNALSKGIADVRAAIPTETPPHAHTDLVEAIAMLRSENTSLRAIIASLETRFDEALSRATASLRAEMQDIQPKGDYATKADLESLTKRKGEFVLLSSQEVNGKTRWALEEA